MKVINDIKEQKEESYLPKQKEEKKIMGSELAI